MSRLFTVLKFDKIINFNNIPGATHHSNSIPNGYCGFNWKNVAYMHESEAKDRLDGFKNAFTSSSYVAFNAGGRSMSIKSGTPVSLLSIVACAVTNDNLQLTLTGSCSGHLMMTKAVILKTNKSKIIELGWKNIDEVHFDAEGGTPHTGASTTRFAIGQLNLF
ncbi:unnamed protein product [Didymodactylos carnosus]|uniref:Uncharacterized protein n=1 Tax=Didymodactylos carnosus TaxID=1234261 RepID=A0A814EEN5_9BILA|nr:unnamed protein product [Didymodactylos carnosus]CAF3740439.1 unnamed protein product [Didymodactylos carnosus]